MSELGKRETSDYSNDNSTGSLSNFKISDQTKTTLTTLGYKHLFPIQIDTFTPVFEGKDVIGKDRTGSGKTLAFGLPILEKLREKKKMNGGKGNPQVLVLVPTRELCQQVGKEIARLQNFRGEYRLLALYGGIPVDYHLKELETGCEIVVGTPGRVIDLINREALKLSGIEHFVLDETDQMLDIGFKTDIEKVFKALKEQKSSTSTSALDIQVLLFSATIPQFVNDMASEYMKPDYCFVNKVSEEDSQASKTLEHFKRRTRDDEHKLATVKAIIAKYTSKDGRAIIFTETKKMAAEMAENNKLEYGAKALHGDVPQKIRDRIFADFREGKLKVLIATNVAARGLDISGVEVVIQMSPPRDLDTYIHRAGRSARAGKQGICVVLFTDKEKFGISKIEDHAKIKMNEIEVQVKKENQNDNNNKQQNFNKNNFNNRNREEQGQQNNREHGRRSNQSNFKNNNFGENKYQNNRRENNNENKNQWEGNTTTNGNDCTGGWGSNDNKNSLNYQSESNNNQEWGTSQIQNTNEAQGWGSTVSSTNINENSAPSW